MRKRSTVLVLITGNINTRNQYDATERSKNANKFLDGKLFDSEECSKEKSPNTYVYKPMNKERGIRCQCLLLVDVNIVELATVVYSRQAATK